MASDTVNKRTMLIGAIIFLISLLALSSANQQISSSIGNSNLTSLSATLSGNAVISQQISTNSTSFLEAGYQAAYPMDFYITDASAYNSLRPYMLLNQSLFPHALNLTNDGIISMVNSSPRGIFPYEPNYIGTFPQPYGNYTRNVNSSYVTNGTYYVIIQNDGSTNNTVLYYYYKRAVPSAVFLVASVNPTGVLGTLMLLAGLIIFVYGAVAKGGEKGEEKRNPKDEEVYNAYRVIEKRPRMPGQRKKSTAKRRKPK
ncbi:MAG: hypothetical protein KGH72_02250 [Candidatus Micrarchaeota archaeon]|nr:hypothetical protein [Candidatus Micrarchaeota archaeon]